MFSGQCFAILWCFKRGFNNFSFFFIWFLVLSCIDLARTFLNTCIHYIYMSHLSWVKLNWHQIHFIHWNSSCHLNYRASDMITGDQLDQDCGCRSRKFIINVFQLHCQSQYRADSPKTKIQALILELFSGNILFMSGLKTLL